MALSWDGIARVRYAQEERAGRSPRVIADGSVARRARAFLRAEGLDTSGSDADVIARANEVAK